MTTKSKTIEENHLMLDWFNNVEKMVTPYIKAVFCTYYPDDFQGEYRGACNSFIISDKPFVYLINE